MAATARTRTRPARRRVGIAVVSSLLLAACSASSSSHPSTAPATTIPVTTLALPAGEWQPGVAGGSFDLPGGGTIAVPAGAAGESTRLRVEPSDPGSAALAGMAPVTPAVSIELLGGSLAKPATVSYPLPAAADETGYLAATWDGERWQPVEGGTYDAATHVFSIELPHFSIWRIFSWDLGSLLRKAFEALYDLPDTSALTCTGGQLTDGYRAWVTDGTDALSGCASVVDGRFTATIKNRRYAAFSIELLPTWTGTIEGAEGFTDLVTQALLDMSGRTFLIIPGGETATISGTVAPGGRVTMPISQDMFSWTIDGLLFAAQVYALGAKAAGSTDSLSIKIRAGSEQLGVYSDIIDCIGKSSDYLRSLRNGILSQQAAEKVVPVIWNCAKVVEDSVAAVIATLISLVMSPIKLLWQLFELGKDLGKNRELHVERRDPATPPSAGGLPAAFDGTWGGTVSSSDSRVADFPVSLVIGDGGIQLDLPSSGCVAPLTVAMVDGEGVGAVATLTGRFTAGDCVQGGSWMLTLTGATTLHYAWTSADGNRTDEGDLTLGGPPGGDPGGQTSAWPTTAGLQGPSALYVYFGSELIFPEWVSCTDDSTVCIAGNGTEVRVYTTRPLNFVAAVDVGDDPTTALTGLGASPEQIAQLLSP